MRTSIALLFCCVALLIATPAHADKRVALVIGNSAYQHTAELHNPKNDAADMASSLRRLGFEVLEGRDLDKRGMERLIRQFGLKLSGADLALFFYAGHGVQLSAVRTTCCRSMRGLPARATPISRRSGSTWC